MIQTNYVPLEHPFRIIEFNGTLGIQIGTLIVTREVEGINVGGYEIETHSHPVVSYVNNHKSQPLESPFLYVREAPVEGVVWDKVEVGQVRTLMRENEALEWCDFMDYCRSCKIRDLRNSRHDFSIKVVGAWATLQDWGFSIKKPKAKAPGAMVLEVELYDMVVGKKAYCLGRGGLGLATEDGKLEDMVEDILRQVQFYEMFVYPDILSFPIKVVFNTTEKRYAKLVTMLNRQSKESRSFIRYYNNFNSFYDGDIEEEMPLMAAEDESPVR